MIRFVGDLHGEWRGLQAMDLTGISAIVQVGDFGFYPHLLDRWQPLSVPVYACDGNHEWHPFLPHDATEPWKVAEGLFYLPRGAVVEIGGRKIGVCGGAASIDYAHRTTGRNWHPDLEVFTDAQLDRLIGHIDTVDILVTHTLPQSEVDKILPGPPPNFGQARGWFDPCGVKLERLKAVQGERPWFCGHFHGSYLTPAGIRVLDIAEFVDV